MPVRRFWILMLLLTVLLTACSYSQRDSTPTLQARSTSASEDRDGCLVERPPRKFRFAAFYAKYCDADGIPIISSEEVDDLALQQAAYIINNMLAPIPDVREYLVTRRHYVAIIGKDQGQTTLPEYRHMDSEYWDQRARGLGGDQSTKITSSGEENLLCLGRWKDRYHGENILVHEFAHTVHLAGLGSNYKDFNSRLQDLYYTAYGEGLWEDTYAITNHREYWAEGVQTYFNTNLSAHPADGVHSKINTREELAEYDPALYEFIAEFFNGFDWTPLCPE
jgi:alpha-glucosidase